MATATLSALPALVTPPTVTGALPLYPFTVVVPNALFPTDSPSLALTLSLCLAPLGFNQSNPNIFTAYTNDTFAYYPSVFQNGFANISFPILGQEDSSPLTVQIDPGLSDSDAASQFSFELGVSTEDTDGAVHILDRHPLFAWEDSDNGNALLTSPTWPSNLVSQPAWQPVTVLTRTVRDDLSSSSCYVRSLKPQVTNITTSETTRGVVELTLSEGGRVNETLRGGKRLQYALGSLEPASNYSLWGIQQSTVNGINLTRLFTRQSFATKAGTSQMGSCRAICADVRTGSNCRLVYDVPFCPDLAYSVPAPPDMSTSDLLSLYNDTLSHSIGNFSRALSTFPCDGHLRERQGQYSRVRTCAQCLSAYTAWLCAIRMPRCTDYDSSPTASNISTELRTFPRLAANESRTTTLPAGAFPYSEVPPCLDVCHIVQASCPPVINNAFMCPLEGVTAEESYGTPYTLEESDKKLLILQGGGNQVVQGGDDPAWFQYTMQQDGEVTRAKDRWGNVKCNDMGVINLVNRRRWSGSAVGSSARRAVAGLDWRIACSVALAAIAGLVA